MRTALFMAATLALVLGAGVADRDARAMTDELEAAPKLTRFADIADDTPGLRTWIRITKLGGLEDLNKRPQTFFAPSDAAFGALPKQDLCALLTLSGVEPRRSFLGRAATDFRISPQSLAGRRISVMTLDGGALTIDATGGELMVGDAEALDVRTMPDGTVIFILDEVIVK